MDTLTDAALAGLMDGPRARGAFLLRSVLEPPWAIRIEDEAPLTLVTMVDGDAWVTAKDTAPSQLCPGAVAILRGPHPYTIGDDPTRPAQVIIGPGQQCTTVHGAGMGGDIDLNTRTWGRRDHGSAVMLSGTYQLHNEIGKRLLGVLPPLLLRPISTEDRALITLLAGEMSKNEPGQELILDRILDLLLVKVIRAWLAAPGSEGPAWYHAQRDPSIGRALHLLHEDPAYAWTVSRLAAKTGLSRASLASRFTKLVGEPPMNYLTGWRLALAADLLRDESNTIASVAREVGYSSGFALSAAFKRVRGVSPQEHRRAQESS